MIKAFRFFVFCQTKGSGDLVDVHVWSVGILISLKDETDEKITT